MKASKLRQWRGLTEPSGRTRSASPTHCSTRRILKICWGHPLKHWPRPLPCLSHLSSPNLSSCSSSILVSKIQTLRARIQDFRTRKRLTACSRRCTKRGRMHWCGTHRQLSLTRENLSKTVSMLLRRMSYRHTISDWSWISTCLKGKQMMQVALMTCVMSLTSATRAASTTIASSPPTSLSRLTRCMRARNWWVPLRKKITRVWMT